MRHNVISLAVAAAAFALPGWSQTPGPAQAHMESIDTNNDGVAEYSEFAAIYDTINRRLFQRMDVNGDGVVQQGEFDNGPAQYILDALGNTPWVPDIMADLDEDGCVCYPELEAVLPGFPEPLFRSLDRDGDGNLDLIEFNTEAAQAVITEWEDRTIFIEFKTIDTNGDGILSIEELRTALPDHDVEKIQDIAADVYPNAVVAIQTDTRTVYYPVARILE